MSVKASINNLKKMNEKMYHKLCADERFKMVINTFVNGDELQREKLVKSCPKVTYFVLEQAYTERIEASRDITTVFIIQLLEYDKIISIMKVVGGYNYKDLDLNNEVKFLSGVQAFILASETFCREHMGIESRDMIQAWYGYDERYVKTIEKIKQSINFFQIEHDPELKKIWLEKVFLNAWESRVKD